MMGFCSSCRAFFGRDEDFANFVKGVSACVAGVLVRSVMTQDERWNVKYNEVVAFIERERRNPSRHRIEEHDMLNWLKANRKKMNKGEMGEPRLGMFERLLEMGEGVRRVNQWG